MRRLSSSGPGYRIGWPATSRQRRCGLEPALLRSRAHPGQGADGALERSGATTRRGVVCNEAVRQPAARSDP